MGALMSRKAIVTCTLLLASLLTLALTTNALAEEVVVGRFSRGDLGGWQEKSFVGHTQYQIVATPPNSPQGQALQAQSQGTASGLFKEITIDLKKTPWLNWSWRIDSTFSGNDERSKGGDDYPARVYVVVSGGLLFWKTRAINYVWSSNQALDSGWDNAYTSNAKMVALRSGTAQSGRWLTQKRNVREDLKRLFGEELGEIHAVAVMTDSDNTGKSAAALYGDIFFSSE
jgi:hypothetical protein